MQIRFQRYPSDGNPAPDAGELWLIPSDTAGRGRRDLAVLALDSGIPAFVSGAGTPTAIVVQSDPTLDDMLAATTLVRRISDEPLPDGLMAYARYVAAVREGLRPGTVPLETSLEGVFLACRTLNGADLTDADNARNFLAAWENLARCLFDGADNGIDPFNNSLLAKHAGFVRERAFLNEDQKVYLQDVRNGERLLVKLPQGPPVAGGLLLREPKSVLWKYWARSDARAPEGCGYLFTGIDRGEGDWVFSTDPIHRVPIRGLAEVLQKAELEQVGTAAGEDPWFDGKPFDFTLVAAPRRRSKLPSRTIKRLVRRWSCARNAPTPASSGKNVGRYVSIAISTCVAILLALILAKLSHEETPDSPLPVSPQVTHNDRTFTAGQSRLFVLGIGPSYRDPTLELNYTDNDVEELIAAFREHSSGYFGDANVRLNPIVREQATRTAVLEGLQWLERGGVDHSDAGPDSHPSENDLVIMTISGHGVVGEDGEYFLLTHESEREQDPRIHGVRWGDLAYTLNQLPCTSIVILDTCHSGATTLDEANESGARDRGASRDSEEIYEATRRDAGSRFSSNSKGVIILPACLGNQTAKEHPDWRHGALSLAVLEAITGELVPGAPPLNEKLSLPPYRDDTHIVNFADLKHYVAHRVYYLTESFASGPQVVDTEESNSRVRDRDIPIAERR